MKRAPITIKKELVELRSTLKRLKKKLFEAEEAAARFDNMVQLGARFDADIKVRDVKRDLESTERAIRAAEEELMGDWAPKSWRKAEA